MKYDELEFWLYFRTIQFYSKPNMRFSFLEKYKYLGFDAIPLRTTLTTIYLEEKVSERSTS